MASCWTSSVFGGEEAVQSQLRSSHRNYNTYGQVSRAMQERGHDREALQCQVKVKELQSAYCKAREGNRRSGAAPMTCRFYKELDAILGGDPTANPRTMMDTSERGGEEETESEGTGVGGDTSESLEACSQELFSSQEEGSQSQQPVLGGGQTEERVPATLSSRLPALSTAQRLQNLRKKLRKSKDLLEAVMDHSATENQKVQDWRQRERESRIRQKNAAARKKSTKQLISLLACQTDSIQALIARQTKHYHTGPLRPKALSLVPQCQLKTPFPSIQVLTITSCLQHLYVHQPALRTTTLTLCTQPPSPCSIGTLKCSSHCTALQTGHIQTCDCTVPHRTPCPFRFPKCCVSVSKVIFFSINEFLV
ncbi:uncharacterized protein LOC142047005 [Chelonoidis abingdonii]|uniref:uncharacterized protein LOC142047005 n=1 Tax=Chelonoidis abingdonii TaxID=106734 RepID=UPI003F4953E2